MYIISRISLFWFSRQPTLLWREVVCCDPAPHSDSPKGAKFRVEGLGFRVEGGASQGFLFRAVDRNHNPPLSFLRLWCALLKRLFDDSDLRASIQCVSDP